MSIFCIYTALGSYAFWSSNSDDTSSRYDQDGIRFGVTPEGGFRRHSCHIGVASSLRSLKECVEFVFEGAFLVKEYIL